VTRSEHVSGQTGNGACGDLVLVCETGALRLCVVVSWCRTCSLARIVAIFKLPLGLCEPDPRSLCTAPCAVQPLPSFWCLHLPSRESALILSSRCCPFLSHPLFKPKHLFLPRRSFSHFLAHHHPPPVDLRCRQSLAITHSLQHLYLTYYSSNHHHHHHHHHYYPPSTTGQPASLLILVSTVHI
jgi:hypothetical protein